MTDSTTIANVEPTATGTNFGREITVVHGNKVQLHLSGVYSMTEAKIIIAELIAAVGVASMHRVNRDTDPAPETMRGADRESEVERARR